MLSGYKTYYPRAALSAGTGITYNASTGVITNSSPSTGGTVTSVATNTGSGITGGTITTSGTIAADTSILATRLRVQKGIDSVNANVNLRVKYTDTAAMLSPYTRSAVGGYVPYTGATTNVNLGANNIYANALYTGFSSITASGTQVVLTVNSAPEILVSGSGGQTIKLPDATTLANGTTYSFNNNQTSGAIIINNNSNTLVVSIPSGGYANVILLDNSIAAGSWDRHFQAPSNVSWSTNTFDYAGSITSATWNGNTIQPNRGGTGQSTYTDGQLLIGNSTGNTLSKSTLTAGTGISITNGAGAITIASSLTNPITGTGTSGQVAYFNGTTSLTSDATFTYSPTSVHLINNSVTAASAIARGTYLTPTLTAAANSDVLVGLDINPTFTNGAFTGVSNLGLRVQGAARVQGALTLYNTTSNFSAAPMYISSISNSTGLYQDYGTITLENRSTTSGTYSALLFNGGINQSGFAGIHGVLGTNTSGLNWNGDLVFATRNLGTYDARLRIFNNGNVVIQNGGTFTDNAFRLDVNGTARIQGITTITYSDNTFLGGLNITNTNTGTNSLSGIYFTQNSVLGGIIAYQPSNYGVASQVSSMLLGSSGLNRVGIVANSNSSGAAQDIYFSTLGSNTTYQMQIKGNGNVQIGTNTDAGYKLDVNGTARVQGLITTTGGLSSTGGLLSQQTGANSGRMSLLNLRNTGGGYTAALNSSIAIAFTNRDLTGVWADDFIELKVYNNGTTTSTTGYNFFTHNNQNFAASSVLAMSINGQSVGIGVETPNASAKLQIESTTQGFLPPRMTTTQRDAIATPATGLQVYNTTTNTNDLYNGSAWVNGTSSSGTSGQIAYFNASNSLTSSSTLAYTPTSALTLTGSITASSAIARGQYNNTTLVAAANNDVLVGLDINPTFTNGAFTGVSNYGIRSTGQNVLGLIRTFSTGNTYIGVNPQTATDASYKLDVNGTIRASGAIRTDAGNGVVALNLVGSTSSIQATPSGSTSYILLNSQSIYATLGCIANSYYEYRSGSAGAILRLGTSSPNGGGIEYYASYNNPNGYHKWFFNNVQYAQLTIAQYVLDDSGTLTANSSTILQANSTTKGFLPPRMTTAQKNAIASPATGLVVYDTTLNKLAVFTGSVWETISSL